MISADDNHLIETVKAKSSGDQIHYNVNVLSLFRYACSSAMFQKYMNEKYECIWTDEIRKCLRIFLTDTTRALKEIISTNIPKYIQE